MSALLIGMIFVEVGRLQVSEIYSIKAKNATEKKDYETAEAYLSAALAYNPNNEALYLNLGNLYNDFPPQTPPSLEVLNKSRQAYQAVIERNKFSARAWSALAVNCEKIHQASSQGPKILSGDRANPPGAESDPTAWTGEAEDYFQRAMAHDPNNVFYMLSYVSFLVRTDRFDKAKELYGKAYNTSPAVLNQYYVQNSALGRVVEEHYWEEINKDPDKLEYYYHLGRWYFYKGLYAHALAVYHKARSKTSGHISQDQEIWSSKIERQVLNVELALRKQRRK